MLRGAIVPKDDRARAPTESALDFGDGGLGVEMREQSLAFLCRQAFDMAREGGVDVRSEEHTSELQSLMRISYAVFCLKKKTKQNTHSTDTEKTITQQ